MGIKSIDIVDMLRNYARWLDAGGLNSESTEIKLMLEAAEKIEQLRKSYDLVCQENERNNKSRLHYMDLVLNAIEILEDKKDV